MKTIQPRVAVLDTRSAKPPAKQAAPIYLTREHQQWRATVIARAGGRCEWPGCDRSELRMFADHIVELKDRGDAFDIANGQCLCGSHHTSKTNMERARRMSVNIF
jgi:5-methylcytosine-specific restriction protein A